MLSDFVAVYAQLPGESETVPVVFANVTVHGDADDTAEIAIAEPFNVVSVQLAIVILSVTTRPGFELKVIVSTVPLRTAPVIVGTIVRANVNVFESLDFATGSLNLRTILAATPASRSPLNGVAPNIVGAEESMPIVIGNENGKLKLS